jgi:hypothetical protein
LLSLSILAFGTVFAVFGKKGPATERVVIPRASSGFAFQTFNLAKTKAVSGLLANLSSIGIGHHAYLIGEHSSDHHFSALEVTVSALGLRDFASALARKPVLPA